MAFTRRQFLTRTGLAAAGSLLGPAFLRNPFLQRALADAIGDQYLVVLFLDGGNDGLNTVTPVANGSTGALRSVYQTMRNTGSGGLQLAVSDQTATAIGNDAGTGTPLALHPSLTGFKTLYDAGRLAVIQGCGYPDYNLSHEQSRVFWQTGDPLKTIGGSPTGWMGRYLVQAGYDGADISSVNIRDSVAGEFKQTATNVLAFSRLRNFGFPHDSFNSDDQAFRKECCAALYAEASGGAQSTQRYLGDTGGATMVASEVYPPLDAIYKSARPSWDTGYTNLKSGTANGLREVAKIIYGVENDVDPNVYARFFEVRNGGYDTHSNQGAETGQHANLHAEVGNAVAHFYADLSDMGIAHKLCIVVWSEFSRRIQQNDNGTDHGSQGPMFVIGGTVNGGIYGNHANIGVLDSRGNTTYSQTSGDPYRSTDFRDVFGTILKHWLGLPNPAAVFPPDSGSPATYWTSPNFDLGFLS